MLIRTENSTYLLRLVNGEFIIKKIAESKRNPYGINVGYENTFVSPLYLELGESANFGGLRTSHVLEIQLPTSQEVCSDRA